MDNKPEASYKSQQKVSFLTFISELPNFILVTISAFLSGSLIVWMDFVDSLGNILNSGFVALLSRKLRKDLRYEYNYGVGKVEAISSLACDGILICGLIMMLISSVNDLLSPKEPSGILIYVVILKIINVTIDTFFLRAQYRIRKTSRTTISESEFHSALESFAFDTVALVSLLICWLFRDIRAVWYFSPVICIALSVWFFIGALRRSAGAVNILTDRTLPEETQLKIMSVLSEFHSEYEEFDFISSRMSGNTAYIDIKLKFRDDMTYAEIKTLCTEISQKMKTRIEDCHVNLVID